MKAFKRAGGNTTSTDLIQAMMEKYLLWLEVRAKAHFSKINIARKSFTHC